MGIDWSDQDEIIASLLWFFALRSGCLISQATVLATRPTRSFLFSFSPMNIEVYLPRHQYHMDSASLAPDRPLEELLASMHNRYYLLERN
jgi:hypothetical protein